MSKKCLLSNKYSEKVGQSDSWKLEIASDEPGFGLAPTGLFMQRKGGHTG